MKSLYWLLFLPFFFACQSVQHTNQSEAPATNQSNPDNVAHIHLYFLQPDTYEPAKSAIVFDIEDRKEAEKLAIQLKAVLDAKGIYVPVGSMPMQGDYKDSLTLQHHYEPFPKELPGYSMSKLGGKWYYSSETVHKTPIWYAQIYSWPVRSFNKLLSEIGLSHLDRLTKTAISFAILLLITGIVFFIINRFLLLLASNIKSWLFKRIESDHLSELARIISLIIMVLLIRFLLPALQLKVEFSNFLHKCFSILIISFFILGGFVLIKIGMTYFVMLTGKTKSKMDDQLVPIVQRTTQFFVAALGIIEILSILEINVTALIAGISIGSLAIALAAQDTIKNLFGSATIFIDKPFQIGDWIQVEGVDGTVEEVGFRSTRIRTFANSLVYIPNGKVADAVINNFGLRLYRRFKMNVGVTYNTPPDKIEQFVESLREMVKKHPSCHNESYHIYVNGMSASSIDILVYVFFDVPDWADELKGKQELILEIMKIAQQQNVSFAFPSTSLYFENAVPKE